MRVCALQSGTSADGIDVLVVDAEIDGDTLRVRPVRWRTKEWDAALRRDILQASHGDALDAAAWCALDTRLGEAFAAAVHDEGELDLVVSHGQTLYHWVEAAGCPVISHLRHADIASGGEGAPLMAVLDRLWLGAEVAERGTSIATVNIGGIANIQITDPDGGVRAWDTGPGNALIDALVDRRSHGRESFDRDGALAGSGQVDTALLAALQRHPYFARPVPKTTGRHEFSSHTADDALGALAGPRPTDADIAATLAELTAWSIAAAIRDSGATEVLVSGGGVHNPVLMRRLVELAAPARVVSTADRGIDPDSRENLMFAVVGLLSWFGTPVQIAGPARRIAGRFTPSPQGLTLPAPRPPLTRLEIRA